jgi:hypothetical protein
VRRWQQLACVAIVVILCIARFVGLNDTPAGFYLDEAAGAATILCLDEPRLFFEAFPAVGFPFARIAWDPPLAPCFAMWGVYCFLKKRDVIGGLFFAAAMYAYPPARLHVPLIVLVLSAGRASARLLGTLFIACIPLVVLTVNGTLNARANALAVWNVDHPFARFFSNLLAHLSPDFLLFKGDLNPRHGTQAFGVLSWLDVLAIVLGVWLLRRVQHKVLVLALAGAIGALVVASLTWEGIPHALRAITGWPFVALLTGTLLAAACARWRVAPYLVLLCALTFSFFFLKTYFTTYREASAPHFDAVLRQEAEEGDWTSLRGYWAFYPRPALRYYFLHYARIPCASLRGDELPPLPADGQHRP